MDIKLEPIVQALQEKFSTSLEEFRNEVHVFVNPADIIEALTLLRDKYDFELLSAMTATDYFPQQSPRFHVIYQLSSLARNTTMQLRVPVDGSDPQIPTATGVYEIGQLARARAQGYVWHRPSKAIPIRRILLLPEDWDEKHPLRKDFPLGYEEVAVHV